jgi:hypothetical protein
MQRQSKSLVATVAVSFGIAALVAPAESFGAISPPAWARYRVEISGSANYNYAATRDTQTEKAHATFTFSGGVDNVAFNGDKFDRSTVGATNISAVDFEVTMDDSRPHADPNHGSCGGSVGAVMDNGMYVHTGLTPLDGSVPVVVDPFQTVLLSGSCTGLLAGNQGIPFSNIELGDEYSMSAPFDVAVSLPADAMRMGKVIELFDKQVPTSACPNSPGSTTCTLTLKGSVTFLLKGYSDSKSKAAPPGSKPAPSAQPAPPSDDDLLVPLVQKAVSVASNASAASVDVGCTGPCAYLVQAFIAAVGGHASDASARPLASAHGSLRAAGTRHVKLRFSKAARRAIRRAGGLRIVVSAHSQAGNHPSKRTVTLRIRRR